MAPASNLPPRKPLGRALRWTALERARLATPSGWTQQQAAAWWRAVAPLRWRGLLDALPVRAEAGHDR